MVDLLISEIDSYIEALIVKVSKRVPACRTQSGTVKGRNTVIWASFLIDTEQESLDLVVFIFPRPDGLEITGDLCFVDGYPLLTMMDDIYIATSANEEERKNTLRKLKTYILSQEDTVVEVVNSTTDSGMKKL